MTILRSLHLIVMSRMQKIKNRFTSKNKFTSKELETKQLSRNQRLQISYLQIYAALSVDKNFIKENTKRGG